MTNWRINRKAFHPEAPSALCFVNKIQLSAPTIPNDAEEAPNIAQSGPLISVCKTAPPTPLPKKISNTDSDDTRSPTNFPSAKQTPH